MEKGSFCWAIEKLKGGLTVTRTNWIEGRYIKLGIDMIEQWLPGNKYTGEPIMYFPFREDIFALDWKIFE